MNDKDKFLHFAKLMGYEIQHNIIIDNERIIFFNDNDVGDNVYTYGSDSIDFMGVFDLEGNALKLFNVSHVAYYPQNGYEDYMLKLGIWKK